MKNKEYLKELDHSKEKKELLALLLEEEGLNLDKPPVITPREGGEVALLSFAQQRLWFLNQLDTSSAYNIRLAIRLKGLPNIKALEDSLNEIIRRHEALRTTFRSIGGGPVQVIAENMSLEMPLIDLSGQPRAEREVEAERLTRDEAMRRFDLAKGPLFNALLIRLAEEEHILLLTMHHIVSDGWSMGIFTAELTALYKAFCNGEASPLPALPIQYADFAHWQREWLQGEVLENQLSYWRKQLKGLPMLQLPTDHPRPAVQTYQGAYQYLLLSATLTETLNALSHAEGATLFMTLLAAFNTLLYRHTGQEDIVMGSPIANRNREEIEGLIGFFVNSLAMRTDLSGNPTFRELIRRVKRVTLGAYEHQDLPFEKLVEELNPERDMSHTPLFQVMFNMINVKDIAVELHNLSAERVSSVEFESKFDFTLHVMEIASGIKLSLVYNTDLFDSWRMAQMLKQYQMLLESIVADSDQRISELSLLTEAERHQILVKWNDNAADYPEDKCIHTLFETQAEQSPEAVAVIFGDEQLSYDELNCRANQLAHYLRQHGVGSEQVVGICMERSLEMVIGLLAILKAGGAYVALEPDFPGARLSFMLEDTKPGLLLTLERLLEKIPEYSGKVVCLDRDRKLFQNEQEYSLKPISTPEDLAYVTYTSGSTGKPKGILTSHRNVVQHLHDFIHKYSLSAIDIVLQIPSFSFDASVRDIFGSLMAGARIVVVRNDEARDPSALVAKIAENHVSCILSITPSLLTQLVDAGSHKSYSFAALRHISAAGEPLPMALCKRVQDVFGCSVVNQYGPTECTLISSYHRVVDLDGNRNIALIGRPIANTQFYVLDAHLNPVPVGVAGEAYIGGLGVSKGYLNLPDLTAEKFIPNPFSNEPGAHLYKTGDMVRYLPDGTMEFLGRRDFQVKLRGVRIELGEVEATLCLHPSVSEAVVVAREDRPGDKRLVAYVVAAAAADSAPATGVLRAFLQEKLPDYMIPSAFVSLDALPLTANRKVDRRALPAPDRLRPELEEVFIAPRTQTEELVAGIWSNVLGLERIGVHDNFFELGGHSLLVVQIVSRIREVFEVELPVRALFEAPTVARLTERIETARRNDEGLQTSPLQAVSRDQDLPLSFAQERLWFLHHLEPDSVAYSMPRSIRLKGVLRKNVLEKTYVELVRRHETLRTTFHSTDGNPELRIAAEPNIVFDTLDLRHLPGVEREAEVKRLSAEDARKPFDLRRGPLFRIQLFQLEDEEHVLHFNMHHIISDFWSFGVMAREITALYTAFIKGKPADLPELPVQYADYAVWQRQWLQGEALEAQLNYWQDKLGGELPVLELPTDRPRPAVQTHRGAIKSFTLSKELTEALQAMSRREGVTLFMTLLAAFKTLLYRLTGQEDTIVGTPIAGRNRTELEGLIGFFMNTIVMRTDLSGNPTFRELLGRVRETALGAYAHQDMPFAKLVEELSPERDLSRTPLFQVFFNHIVAMGDKAAKLPGLEAETVGGLDRESKFDMTLTVLEGEEGLAGAFEYNTDLFDAEHIERMVGHFKKLLEGITANPEKRLSELEILAQEERDKLLVEYNATEAAYPSDKTLVQLFEDQVARSPQAVAVVQGGTQLTYAELNGKANQVAHYLRALGVQPDRIVGICTDRSLDMVVGLIGILKAGGAYTPLDPHFPADRIEFMLEDSNSHFLITQSHLQGIVGRFSGEVICIDSDWGRISKEKDINPKSPAGPNDLAYVIYTSGSTGKPKGVQIPHRALVNFLCSMRKEPGLTSTDTLLSVTTMSFDIFGLELFLPLITSARVIIAEQDDTLDGFRLAELLKDFDVSVMQATPSTWRLLIESGWSGHDDLKVICGGEAFPSDLVGALLDRCGELWNFYGPTETTIWSTAYRVKSKEDPMLIGLPIANTQTYILDSSLQPVALGVVGELYIGGDGLSRGYLNRPELTAEKFMPHPFSEDAGARIYITGDLARYRPDGKIECLGRIDHQVKLRGFRIELGEIEARIKEVEAVSNCVVVLREDRPADTRLVAYYVVRDEQAVEVSDIRRHLQAKLPDYMVPQHFMELAAIPLTPNGKVDRQALPKPEADGALEQGYVAPRTEAEQKIAAVWQEVLNSDRVGIHDNFFDLGGHSLLATRVVSRVRQEFHVDLRLMDFFKMPTIAELAKCIEGLLWINAGRPSEDEAELQEREEGIV